MKIQNLAVIFVIIMLPISIILTSYTQNQLKTLDLQILYDSKLNDATYDAVKAFQLNTINSSTSDLANSKMRDIEASANTFFTTIASNFNMAGYNSDVLKEYVPALVYTLYDGYYIYSPFTNELNDTQVTTDSTFQNGERISGLKPYVYYSCRYQSGLMDVVITYSLDNYITVQGTNRAGEGFSDAGYLIDQVQIRADGRVFYRGIEIEPEETLQEYLNLGEGENSTSERYSYLKINGVKYYKDIHTGRWFTLLNGVRYWQNPPLADGQNDMAYRYYKEAGEFRERLRGNGILDLRENDAVEEIPEFNTSRLIFNYNSNNISIEEPNSDFNQHRLAVIRHVIEKNLSIAIANYNNYSTVTTDFQMPELQEEEWEQVLNHVCMISFLQGLNIGGKIYNGYAIISNNLNEEIVSEDSIYIAQKNDNRRIL